MSGYQTLFQELYRAFNAREIDTVLSVMRRDVDWPNGMEGGRIHGHDAVRAYWVRQWGMIDPAVEPTGVIEDAAARVVVSVHQIVRDLGGKVLSDQKIEHIYTMAGGLVSRMDIRKP